MTAAVPAAARPAPVAEQLGYWYYRLGGYALLHLLDEPAWLALLFC